MSDEATETNRTNVLLLIVVAFLLISIVGTVGFFFLFGVPKQSAVITTTASTPSTDAPVPGNATTSFAGVVEADVPGRYKIDDGGKIMYIVLNDDHTFINQDGTTYAPYNWEVSPDRFTITWQRSSSTLTTFERPGVYSRVKTDGGIMRMEKLPDLPSADTITINDKDVIASMTFTATIQSSNLVPANTENDGGIVPGEAGGQECHHLIRQRGRMSAFLYGRIAPELKTDPFTNAFVMVEYFDSPNRDPRNGWISLQYDGRDGIYTSTAQRVKLGGTMKWTHATFVLDAPLFSGRENDQADFRLCIANPDLSVRAIKVAMNAPVGRFLATPTK